MTSGIIQKRGKSKRGQFTKKQSDYISRCVNDGCVVCALLGNPETPAQWHHEKERWHGGGMRAPHHYGLALCEFHHTVSEVSVHRNPAKFALLVGMTEAQLVDWCQNKYGWQE